MDGIAVFDIGSTHFRYTVGTPAGQFLTEIRGESPVLFPPLFSNKITIHPTPLLFDANYRKAPDWSQEISSIRRFGLYWSGEQMSQSSLNTALSLSASSFIPSASSCESSTSWADNKSSIEATSV